MPQFDVTLTVYEVEAANKDEAIDKVTEELRDVGTDCGEIEATEI